MTVLTEDAPSRRPRRRLVVVVCTVVAASAVAATQLAGGSPNPQAAARSATTVSVVTTDVAETTPVNGTVGFASPSSVVEPAGVAASAVTKDQQAVAAAAQNLAADRQAQADAAAADAQSGNQGQQAIANAQATLAADTMQLHDDQAALAAAQQKQASDCQGTGAGAGSSGQGDAASPCSAETTAVSAGEKAVAADEQKVTADQAAVHTAQAQAVSGQQKAVQAGHQAEAKLASDASALANAQAALTADQAAAAAYDQYSKYTALPTVGQVIAPGQALWSVDSKPVPLLVGSLTPWRAFAAGVSPGPDVAALNHALIALGTGAGLSESDAFTAATATAIIRLQASLGLPQTGTLALGAVVFEPTEIRVTTVHPQVGATVAGGAAVLDVTSTNPIVNVALSVSQTYLVKTGDTVRVTLPDATATSGTVTAVGQVATASTDNSTPTVNVTIALQHASASGSLDKAPVSVSITNRSAHQVLAVPTTALLALAGGG
ncbi:MAG TPA: peptidoglycan-binding protein, partial [Acidimicrobiales bacterium]|nr:peptidoglycan-binding protein [Acidimicrobiales bacterium]